MPDIFKSQNQQLKQCSTDIIYQSSPDEDLLSQQSTQKHYSINITLINDVTRETIKNVQISIEENLINQEDKSFQVCDIISYLKKSISKYIFNSQLFVYNSLLDLNEYIGSDSEAIINQKLFYLSENNQIIIRFRPNSEAICNQDKFFSAAPVTKKIQKQTRTQFKSQKYLREKERTIGFAITIVDEWERIYKNSQTTANRFNYDDAAKIVELSRKTLDNYKSQIKLGKKYGFDFDSNRDEGIGALNRYVEQKSGKPKVKKSKKSEQQQISKKSELQQNIQYKSDEMQTEPQSVFSLQKNNSTLNLSDQHFISIQQIQFNQENNYYNQLVNSNNVGNSCPDYLSSIFQIQQFNDTQQNKNTDTFKFEEEFELKFIYQEDNKNQTQNQQQYSNMAQKQSSTSFLQEFNEDFPEID